MNKEREKIEKRIDEVVMSNSMQAVWLKEQAKQFVMPLVKAGSKEGEMGERARREIKKIMKMEKPAMYSEEQCGLPETGSEMEEKVKEMEKEIVEAIDHILSRKLTHFFGCLFFHGEKEDYLRIWEEIKEYVHGLSSYISAGSDFAETDSIDDMPYKSYGGFDELKDIAYLCRVIRATV